MKNIYIVLAVIALVLIFIFTRSLKALMVTSENVKNKWKQVEKPIERRNDLIRDLVNAVKATAMNEETTINQLSESRLLWIYASVINEKIGIASAVDAALARLFNAIEKYPEVKGKDAFIKVMSELSGVENRIEIEKMAYNEAVRDYNSKVRNLPTSVFANLFGYKLAVEYPDVQ